MPAPQMSFADFLLQSKGLAPIFKPPQMPGTLNLEPQAPPVVPPQIGPQAPQAAPQGLMENLRRDPSLSLALMQAGLSMMQPHSKQQTHVGHIAQSAMGGVNTYLQNEDRLQKKRLLDKESERQDKMVSIAERGDARQQTRAEQEADEFAYSKTRRTFNESIADLQKQGAELGLNVKKLQYDLAKKFGAREAEAKLDSLLAQSQYYKGGGKAGAQKFASKIQEIEHRTATILANNPGMSDAQASEQAWRQEDAARTAAAQVAQQNAQTSELAMWQKVAGEVTRTPEEQAFAKAQVDRLLAQQQGGGGGPAPATVDPYANHPKSLQETRMMFERMAPNDPENEKRAADYWAQYGAMIPGAKTR